MKKLLFIVMLLVLVSISFAFQSTLTFKGGVSQAQTDIDNENQLNGMIGLSYEIWMAKWVSLGLYPYITRVQTGEENAVVNVGTEEVPIYIPNNFKSNIVGGDLLLRLRPNWKPVAPYITAGGGITNFFPKTLSGLHISGYPDDNEHTAGVLPVVGAGLMFFTKHNIDFELGFQKNFVMSDYLDGWETGDDNDSYWMAFLGVSHTFGKVKKVEPAPEPVPVVEPVVEEIPEPVLTVAPTSEKVSYLAGDVKARIEANNAWTATTNVGWLHVTPTSGTGNAVINIKHDENQAYEPRIGKIFISSADLNQVITVTQEAKPLPPLTLKPVYFEFDKTDLTEAAIATLNENIASLAFYPKAILEISGHADEKGSQSYNQKLSEKRADVVKQYIIEKGIAAERLSIIGYGETKPATDNTSEEGRALNRRAEFTEKK